MALTGDPIASITLVSNAPSITFSNIPQTYTDLIVVGMVDTTYTVAATLSIWMRLNGDTGSNYSATWLIGNGSSASSSRNSNQTAGIYVGDVSGSLNYLTPMVAHVASYANTNVNKSVLTSADTAAAFVTRQVGLWRSTAAVTSVTLFGNGYDFTTGSTFDLYGLRGA